MSSPATMTPLARATAGALVIVTFLSVSYAGGRIALGALRPDYRVQVVLGDLGQGVVSGTDVKMRGVIVGSVGRTDLTEDLQAVAELVLEPEFPVPERSTFLVTGKTLLGEKQIEIAFDGPVEQGPFHPEGTVIADPGRVVEFEDVLASLARLVEGLDPDDLAVVVNDFFGAFEGTGPTIARSVDQGARAANVFARTLDDQVPSTRDLSLVAEALGGAGDDFNRLGEAVLEGMPTIADNQQQLRTLLERLREFGRTLDATFTVNRADLDRMIVEGDNVLRLLLHYRVQVGEIVSGIVSYTSKFDPGFMADGVTGQAAYFQIMLDGQSLEWTICRQLPEEMQQQMPACAALLAGAAAPAEVRIPVSRALTRPQVPEHGGLDLLLRRALDPLSGGRPE